MSLFEANPDALSGGIDSAARGPTLGFGEAFSAAYDQQAKANSVLAITTAFENAEAEQARKIEERGGKAPKLSRDTPRFDPYMDAARSLVDGGDPVMGEAVTRADTELEKLREQYPDAGIKNYRELFDGVKTAAQDAEKRWNRAQTSTGGAVGGFLGGAVASLDPRTDPYNFGTLPVAGGGGTAAGRIGIQAGIQGATEAVNQFTGVRENRRLLGLEEQNPLGSVAMAAAGGALFQGAGEAAMAGGRRFFPKSRWFRQDVPHDPAPPPPEPVATPALSAPQPVAQTLSTGETSEAFLRSIAGRNFDAFNTLLERDRTANPDILGPTRAARARTAADLDYVGRSLDDWRGPLPSALRAAGTDTAAPPTIERYTFDIPDRDTVDVRARKVDPDTFLVFDNATRQARSMRDAIARADDTAVAANRGALDTIEAALQQKQTQLAGARSPKVRTRLEAEIADLTQQSTALARDGQPTSAELRAELVKIDEQMRDLAPVVSRAYAAAKGQISAEADSDAGRFLRDLARSAPRIFPETAKRADEMLAAVAPTPLPARALQDDVPIIASRPEATASLGPNADAADKIAAVMKPIEAERDALTDGFRSMVQRVLKPAAEGAEPDNLFTLTSGKTLHLDNDIVPSIDGSRQITVRQFLQEISDDETALRAISTCKG